MKIDQYLPSVQNIQKFLAVASVTLLVVGILAILKIEGLQGISTGGMYGFFGGAIISMLGVYCARSSKPVFVKLSQDTSQCGESIFNRKDSLGQKLNDYKAEVIAYFRGNHILKPSELRAMGAMLGGAAADSLFSHIEFLPYKIEGYGKEGEKMGMEPGGEITGFSEIKNAFMLDAGQWTDDTSMMLCLSDVLILEKGKLHGTQLMTSFQDWWLHGLNNAFRNNPRTSIGLGGNIKTSLENFPVSKRSKKESYRTPASGATFTSGNGSLMRLAPAALVAKNVEEAMRIAENQSYVTHEGREAAECCKVMAYILFESIHRSDDRMRSIEPAVYKKQLLDELAHINTSSYLPSVAGLMKSAKNVPSDLDPDKQEARENWNWKDDDFDYNAIRIKANPGYIGSYAMDALAMALHCVYTTNSFEEAVIKAGERGGDSDSVASITAQIAGALYGVEAIPRKWIDAIHQHDGGGEIAARAVALARIGGM